MPAPKKEKPKHLGRGLQSLLSPIISQPIEPSQAIPIAAIDTKPLSSNRLSESLKEINIDDVHPNPYQPRTVWNQEEISDLADSIKINGVIQPIIVRPTPAGFEVIAGERRLRAAKMASLDRIPALIRPATDKQLLELALVENIHRADLNPIERAKAYQKYLNTFSLTQTEAAQRLGENRSVLANYLRILDLPDDVKQMLADGQLTMGHARAMLALPTDELRRKLANRALAGRLSVREIERLVRKYLANTNTVKSVSPTKPAHILDLENKLISRLGTKVAVETRKNGQKGKIIIEFYSLDDFDRITECFGLASLEEV